MTKLERGKNDLATVNPELAKEWHPTRNNDLTPVAVHGNSSKKVWWLGKCGHEWQATISNRTFRKSGCPYCSGKLPIVGKTDLMSMFPSICVEWDYEKNNGLSPMDVTAKSNRKVWWQCNRCKHSWQATIANRTYNHSGCPYCAGKVPIVGQTDLGTVRPDLLTEWNYKKNQDLFDLTPERVTIHSNRKVWWKCKKNHEWFAPVERRTDGHGCPICSSHLQKSYPETAIFFFITMLYSDVVQTYTANWLGKLELDVYIPSVCTAIEYDGIAYHNKSFSAGREKRKYSLVSGRNIRLIRIREVGLPACDADAIVVSHLGQMSFNSKAYNEELLNIVNQIILLLGGNTEISLELLEKSRADIQSLLYMAADEFNRFPQYLYDEWDDERNGDLRLNAFRKGSGQIVYWVCEKGHSWQASIKSRVGSENHKGTGCPYCSGNKVLDGYNDLVTVNPNIADEWHPTKNGELKPTMFSRGSIKKVWWLGKCGHEWQATIRSRMNGSNCPYCGNQKVLTGFNDLATVNPELAKEWHPIKNNNLTAKDVMPGSHQKVWWIGKCGHEWQASIKERVGLKNRKGTGCPYCSRR